MGDELDKRRLELLIFSLFYLITGCCTSTAPENLIEVNEEMDCGVSVQDRIVGGQNAYLGQWPWLARLGYNSKKSLKGFFTEKKPS